MTTLLILLQAPSGGNPMMTFLFMGLMLAVFYFFLIRPQAKRQKEQQKFLGELKKGDQIVTAAGIVGEIIRVDEKTTTIDCGNKVVLTITTSSVSKDMTEAVHGKK